MIVIDTNNPPSLLLTVDRGSAPIFSLVVGQSGALLDITGEVFGIIINDLPWCRSITGLSTDTNPFLAVTDGPTGRLTLTLPATVTSQFQETYAPRFMVWMDENGGKRPLFTGIFKVRDHG